MDNYPQSTLDNPAALVALLGTYWSRLYPDPEGLYGLMDALAPVMRRLGDGINDAFACLDRHTIPPGSLFSLYPATLDSASATVSASAYPGGRGPTEALDYVVSTGWLEAACRLDKPLEPGAIHFHNLDFRLTNGTLTSLEDLGGPGFWLNYRQGRGLVHHHLGFALGYRLDDSQAYRDMLNAVIDGAATGSLTTFLSAVTDSPVTADDGETVETIFDDGCYQLVMTDRNVYRVRRDVTVLVDPGDVLPAGSRLTGAFELLRPPHRSIPADLTEIVVPAAWLDPSLGGPLTFTNSNETITLSTVSNYTKITWPMPDDAGDVADFFTLLHSRGVAASATLANYLDTRPQPQSTQPGDGELPTTVNPLELLLQVFRNHVWILRLRPSLFGAKALGTDHLVLLRKLVPVETGMLVVVE